MSCQEKQDFAAKVIDSLKFAAGRECITGRVAVADLTRVADLLADSEGWLDCTLEGIVFDGVLAGRLGLHLRVSGQLSLHCQRCLEEFGFDCVIDNRLLLVADQSNADEWPEDELDADEFDAIPASREMSLLTLIEDEVLLALPAVPRHEECVPPAGSGRNGGQALQEMLQESEPSPFAVLAGLKKKH